LSGYCNGQLVLALKEGVNAQGSQVELGALFSDALREVSTPEGTYIGMVKFNVNTIVKALK